MLLDVRGVSKSFGGVAAVADASFAVKEGSITALIGPNGAGKTTVFNVISGFLRADKGTIGFDGRPIERARGDAIAQAGLVRVFQTPRVLTRMTVLENMMLAAKNQPGETLGLAWIAPRRIARCEAEVRRRALQITDLVRLSHLVNEFAGTLSGGQRKLLELGRALMVEPRMILLDEPMAGVAPVLAEQLLAHVQELRANHGVTICVIEHDMDVIAELCNPIYVLAEGRTLTCGTFSEVTANKDVMQAYLGKVGHA